MVTAKMKSVLSVELNTDFRLAVSGSRCKGRDAPGRGVEMSRVLRAGTELVLGRALNAYMEFLV